jgi:hypothetical protein
MLQLLLTDPRLFVISAIIANAVDGWRPAWSGLLERSSVVTGVVAHAELSVAFF